MGSTLQATCGHVIVGGYVGETPPPGFLKRLAAGRLAGTILFKRNLPSVSSAYDTTAMLARSGAHPAFVAIDQEGGRVARLPSPVIKLPPMAELARHNNPELCHGVGKLLGEQLGCLGFNVDFAPVLDVNTNPNNPVIGDRAFGDGPDAVERLALPFAQGLRAAGILPCGKHFPGHGDTQVDSHLALPTVATTLERMFQVELRPFMRAIAEEIPALMTAHIVCAGLGETEPATLCSRIITGLLRARLGFRGLVFSDDLEMKAIADHYGIAKAAERAIEAGCDVVLICKEEDAQEQAYEAILHRAERDSDFRTRLDEAASRSLQCRQSLPYRRAASWAQASATLTSPSATELQSLVSSLTTR